MVSREIGLTQIETDTGLLYGTQLKSKGWLIVIPLLDTCVNSPTLEPWCAPYVPWETRQVAPEPEQTHGAKSGLVPASKLGFWIREVGAGNAHDVVDVGAPLDIQTGPVGVDDPVNCWRVVVLMVTAPAWACAWTRWQLASLPETSA